LKPIEPSLLDRALNKLDRLAATAEKSPRTDFSYVLAELTASLQQLPRGYPTRVASRCGDRVRFIELSRISHFFAHEKLTYAAADDGNHMVDRSVAELETELDPDRFVRIHRATLLNT